MLCHRTAREVDLAHSIQAGIRDAAKGGDVAEDPGDLRAGYKADNVEGVHSHIQIGATMYGRPAHGFESTT